MGPNAVARAFVLAFLSCTTSAHLYVSPEGSDNGNGSAAAPFRTLHRAQSAVREVNADLTADLHVYISDGTYYLREPLFFEAADSGSNGHQIIWQGSGSKGPNISGGFEVKKWKIHDEEKGIYSARTPCGLESRHLYVDQTHADRVRHTVDRQWFTNVTDAYQLVNESANYLLSVEGIEHGEFRGTNSFSDRSVPIDRVGPNSTLLMVQPGFDNNLVGYDTIIAPFHDNGFYIENVFSLMSKANEFYLNSTTSKVFYKPAEGVNPEDLYIVLGRLEQLLVVGGTYDEPVHDIVFQGFNYMHTTWNNPSSNVGYVDQQTGTFIGENKSYIAAYEAARPFWHTVPGSVQVSAAHDIKFTNGSMTAVMGGFGVGNDANAHMGGVGLGAQNIEISGIDIRDTGLNAITIGGVQEDGHHPSDPRMMNANNLITENTISRNGRTYVSGAGIVAMYNNGTEISRNDLYDVPYSGICWGWGWGSNDAGGSKEYENRGLYNYQPRYETPTTQANGLISMNLIQKFGQKLHDLGAIYTLADSPNTNITGNFAFDGYGSGIYHDEGSRQFVSFMNVFNVSGEVEYDLAGHWLNRHAQENLTTGDLTAFNIAVAEGMALQMGENEYGDKVFNVTNYSSLETLEPQYKKVVYEAGIPPALRDSRPVSFHPPRP